MPVRLSANASVEITPRDAMPITSPQEGVIEKVLVRPNQSISQGTLLVRYNESIDKSRLTLAQRNLAVARAELERTTSKSFQDPVSRAELATFRARVQEKAAEARFIEQMLEQLIIRAPLDGAAIFADADEWVGRPVQKGERIMLLADPLKIWVSLFITPEEAIPDLKAAPVKVNLDITPLESLQATVVESGYESVVMPDGRVGYLLRASLSPDQPLPRIGLKGVATVYGERTILAYYIFRKPIRVMRRVLGL
jgi:multidrug resistance efflux pump